MSNRRRLPPPRVGWPATLLALACALTPAFAATQSPLTPPAEPFFWIGLVGLLIGADGAAPLAVRHPAIRATRALAHATAWALGLVLAILAVGQAMPPLGLISQDLANLVARAQNPSPTYLASSLAFLDSSSMRLLGDLGGALNAGIAGARLLISVVGITLTWIGALLLGRAVGSGRALVSLSLPILAALTIIAVPGGAGGWPLALGIGLALAFHGVAGFEQRRQSWERRAIDYSDELGRDVALWSVLLAIVGLSAAWALPLWPGNPISQAIAQIGSVPSGVTALERGIERPGNQGPTVEIGLSTLPSLELGQSIAQGPPDQPALIISLNAPLQNSPIPRYWRLRLFDRYSASGWRAIARVAPQEPSAITAAFDGTIVQTVIDQRPDRQLLIGLADILAADVPTRAERLDDGSLAALAGVPPTNRYTILSRLPELAPLPARDQEPPDMSNFLQLPSNLPPRVHELAVAIVGNRLNDQERALALEAYLRALPYRYEVQPLDENRDGVDQFLFDMRSGYCTYYASAMAVMARSLGIPARIAVGYATGEVGPDQRYTIHESDAHAWPELYIGEHWIPFEPTPIRALPARTPSTPSLNPAPIVARAPEIPVWPLVAVVAILAVTALAVVVLLRRRTSTSDPLTHAAAALERFGTQQGIAWPIGASLREYRTLLSGRNAAVTHPLATIVELIERGRYANKRLSVADLQQLEQAEIQLEQASRSADRSRTP